MKQKKIHNNRKRNLALLVFLAVICIGGAELVACRFFEPALYQKITAPLRQGLSALGAFGKNLWDSAGELLTPVSTPAPLSSAPPEEEPASAEASDLLEEWEPQLAGDPVLENTFPLVDPAITELKTEGNQQILVGNGFPTVYYNQKDPRWANLPYGTDDIGGYGCGPTAMAMVISSMTNTTIDPPAMAQWAYENGYWASESGTYHAFIPECAEAFGLKAKSFSSRDAESLQDALLSGNLLVALMGPGHFTQGGHFIVLRGTALSGEILVADPNSTERSLTAWDPQIIFDEALSSAAHGGPLWLISKPEAGIG